MFLTVNTFSEEKTMVLINVMCMAILLSSVAIVESEERVDQVCSTNNQCVHLQTGNGNSVVCAFNYASCSDLTACEADYSCARPNTICVKHRCHIYPVCYPKSMIGQNICPPLLRESLISIKST